MQGSLFCYNFCYHFSVTLSTRDPKTLGLYHSWYSWLLLQGEGVMTRVQGPRVLILLLCSEFRPSSTSSGSSSMPITLRHQGKCRHSVSLGLARKSCWETPAAFICVIIRLPWPLVIAGLGWINSTLYALYWLGALTPPVPASHPPF